MTIICDVQINTKSTHDIYMCQRSLFSILQMVLINGLISKRKREVIFFWGGGGSNIEYSINAIICDREFNSKSTHDIYMCQRSPFSILQMVLTAAVLTMLSQNLASTSVYSFCMLGISRRSCRIYTKTRLKLTYQQNAWNDVWCSDKCGKACFVKLSMCT